MITVGSEIGVEFGGKAVGLARLKQAGMRVPEAVALTVSDVAILLNSEDDHALRDWLLKRPGSVAVRSSAALEDGSDRSYAGMYESRLYVEASFAAVKEAIRIVSQSGGSKRVESYDDNRHAFAGVIPVILQDMVDPAHAGVLFTDSVTGDGRDAIYVEWVDGDGEKLVGGRVTPGSLALPVARNDRTSVEWTGLISRGGILDRSVVHELIDATLEFMSHLPGEWDIEWAADRSGGVWMLQARPQTGQLFIGATRASEGGIGVVLRSGAGPAFVTADDGSTAELADGDVLIAEITEVDNIAAMRRASAIVTENGGLLSHAAIVARELGKPCVVGVSGARSKLVRGRRTTVDGATAIVQQDGVQLGGGSAGAMGVDWQSISLYDRALDLMIDGERISIEFLPSGPVAYSSQDLAPEAQDALQRQLRVYFGQPLDIRVDQKPLWSLEWRRFRQLDSFCFAESALMASLSRWDSRALANVLDRVHNIAQDVGASAARCETALEQLFYLEFGAALHALVGSLIEGLGQWMALRECFPYIYKSGIPFSRLFDGLDEDSLLPRSAQIGACLKVLSIERGRTYAHFQSVGAFDVEYFGRRDQLLRRVSRSMEPSSIMTMDDFYAANAVRQLDLTLRVVVMNSFWDPQ